MVRKQKRIAIKLYIVTPLQLSYSFIILGFGNVNITIGKFFVQVTATILKNIVEINKSGRIRNGKVLQSFIILIMCRSRLQLIMGQHFLK